MENTTRDVKKINITEEILKRLKGIGYKGKIGSLIQYYMHENIKYLFGDENVSESDVDFVTSNNKIEIKSIYSEQTICIIAGHETDYDIDDKTDYETDFIRCERKVSNDKEPYTEFEIVDSGKNCRSTLALALDEPLKVKTLEHDAKDNKFTLTYLTINASSSTTYYKASLTPIYAKEKDKDWFSYHREVPFTTNDESFLKRIYDELKGVGTSRSLVTSYDVDDLTDYAPVIYNALYEDATRVLKSSFEQENSKGEEKKRVHN